MKSRENRVTRAVRLKLCFALCIYMASTDALDTGITVAPLTADNPVASERIVDKDFKKFDSDPPPEYYK